MSETPRSFVLSRMGIGVDVLADPLTHSWIMARTSHYFTHSNGSDGRSNWQVIAGIELAPARRWKTYCRQSANGESCKYLVDVHAKSIVVDLPPGPWRQLFTLRIVRNILRWELFIKGAVFLHASCISVKGRGIALLGQSRGGKTTALLRLLEQGQADYVTEDDLTVVAQPNGTFRALGWPGCVRVRRSMMTQFADLQINLHRFTHPANRLEEKANPDVGLLRVFPEELSEVYGCKIVPEVTLDVGAWFHWNKANQTLPISLEEISEGLGLSWDILPERKSGARPALMDRKKPAWANLVFDPFLLEAYGVPNLSGHELNLNQIAKSIRGLKVFHCGQVNKFNNIF
jgi:hypothetical protein